MAECHRNFVVPIFQCWAAYRRWLLYSEMSDVVRNVRAEPSFVSDGTCESGGRCVEGERWQVRLGSRKSGLGVVGEPTIDLVLVQVVLLQVVEV